jgi:L-ribulose-5-phosphate 3-epimerase
VLLKSVNYWSYPGGLEGSLPLEDFFFKAKRDGFEAVEVAIGEVGELGLNVTKDRVSELRALADSLELKMPSVASGIYWSYSLASALAEDRQKASHALERMIEITAWFGAKTLLTIPGAVDVFFLPDRQVQSYEEVLAFAHFGLKRVAATAETFHVRLGIENVWNRFLLSPAEMAAFIDSIDSPWVGAYVDVANVLPFGYPEQWLRILGKRVVGIHFKDYRRAVGTAEGFVDLLEGDVNWPEVVKAIEEIGYEGPVAAELIPLYKHHPEVRVQNASRAMDAILGRA